MRSALQKGIYRHYKGKLYEVIDTATHSESLEMMVVYRTLYGHFDLWVRPLSMFLEEVTVDGLIRKRFEWLGENGKATDMAQDNKPA